jgi:tRNA A37 threonylcarbamoyladenosine synthetase subunit TsaC/SUA5/YrdC
MKTETISIKKLKKDGTIDSSITRSLSEMIKSGKTVLMPVDAIYGIVCLDDHRNREIIELITGDSDAHIVRMVSSFKMLNEISNIDKLEFDFLHRIWPGELIVYVEDISVKGKAIPVRMPRSKYQQDIIDHVGKPCLYSALLDQDIKPMYRKKDFIESLVGRLDCLLIIDEFCKEHTLPSVVDISKGTLTIINEGRVSTEEIKSLYFLGKDDSVL